MEGIKMEREDALKLVKSKVSQKNLVKHMLATEAVMRRLAQHLEENEAVWGLAGLIHDLDYQDTVDNPDMHALITADILKEKGLSDEIVHAVLAHAWKAEAETKMDWALYATDPTTGFIVACALMHPSKKLASLDLKFLMNRFKEKRFAAGANREQMQTCEKIDLSLEEFLSKALEAMQGISQELGL